MEAAGRWAAAPHQLPAVHPTASFPPTHSPPARHQPPTIEPCASVTSAFLQILATIHNVEACRVSNPRNILSILSTNTRRTKVVEMSTGTHRVVRRLAIALPASLSSRRCLCLSSSLGGTGRYAPRSPSPWRGRTRSTHSLNNHSLNNHSLTLALSPTRPQADDLRRHSLSDGQGGHYGTNLDRNRYGSDNNYLFTVTKYNLESLGLCPCLVDIEIVDTRNGNESSIVSVGAEACNCEDPARIALQDSATLVLGGDANKKRKLTEKKKMMKKSASFNSGSELFDALLMAAADDNEGGEIVSKEDGAFDCDDVHCDDDTDCGTGTAGAVTTGWPIPYTPGSLRSHIPPHTHKPTHPHTLTTLHPARPSTTTSISQLGPPAASLGPETTAVREKEARLLQQLLRLVRARPQQRQEEALHPAKLGLHDPQQPRAGTSCRR